jgi:hypothetical protein
MRILLWRESQVNYIMVREAEKGAYIAKSVVSRNMTMTYKIY